MASVAPAASERIVVIDEINMVRLWLEEKVSGRELTPSAADKKLQEYEDDGKLSLGPLKDSAGFGKIAYRLARDMKSWRGARVYFVKGKTGDLVVIRGWPIGRKLLPGTRYKVTNPKIVEMQIGKPGLQAAAKESARFGIILVVAMDVGDYLLRDKATLGELLGKLTIDIPSVLLASAIGAAVGSLTTTSSVAAVAFIGTFACGPLLVALVVGAVAGYALYKLDEHFGWSKQLGEAYDRGLVKLGQVWHELDAQAETRFHQLEHSRLVQDPTADSKQIALKLGREADWVRWQFSHL